MNIQGSRTFDTDQTTVWNILIDPESLARCIPGCEKLETVGDEEYRATVRVGIGAIKGTYTGTIRVLDKTPVSRYRLTVEGSGGPGRMQGQGQVILASDDGVTHLTYDGEVQVMGPVAAVGQRLLGAAARQLTGQFFKCVERQILGSADAAQ